MSDDDFGFNIFGDSDHGAPGDMEQVLDLIRHSVDEHGMTFEQSVDILLDLIRPGNSENSHDVRPLFTGAMYAYGHGKLAGRFGAIYLNTMPWGIGFQIAVEQGLRFDDLAHDEQEAVVKSLCVVLQTGGLNAAVADGHIVLTGPMGEESKIDIDTLVGQFREQMDVELGDAPEPDDPMGRWMP